MGGIRGVYAFPKGIKPKVNAIARLVFELAYFAVPVQRVNHYATGIPMNYLGESNVFQYFGNLKQDSAAKDILLRSWEWQTTHNCKMPNLPDTLQVLLDGFVSMAWSTTSEDSILLGQSDIPWL